MTTTFANVRRLALSAAGAMVLSATCIAGAVAPAGAEPMTPNAPLTVADWQADVGTQLDAKLSVPVRALARRDHLLAVVALSFDAAGDFTAARIAQSSGDAVVDRQVVRIAGELAYPPLPAGYRGTPRTVVMQAYFGQANSMADALRHEQAVDALASGPAAKHDAVQTAALPSG